jgi:hypothetical protein
MSQTTDIRFKSCFFLEGENAIEKHNQEEKTQSKEKSAIVAQIRARKLEGAIEKYEIVDTKGLKEYYIYLKDGMITLRLTAQDPYNISLKNILNSKKEFKDKLTITIDGNHFYMSDRDSKKEMSGQNLFGMLDYLDCMKNNKEIASVSKTGKENFSYKIDTKENERIQILVSADNEEVVRRLDKLEKITIQKKNRLKVALAAGIVGISLAVVSPYASKMAYDIKDGIETMIDENNQQFTVEQNFKVMSSYAMRLQNNQLSSEDYENFRTIVNETMDYYTMSGKADTEDYQTLLSYEQLIDENYSNYVRRAY